MELFLYIFLIMALASVEAIRGAALKRSPYKSITISSCWGGIMTVIYLMFLKLEGHPLQETVVKTAKDFANLVSSNGFTVNGMSETEISSFLQSTYIGAFDSLPSIVLIWGAIVSYFTTMFVLNYLNKKAPKGKVPIKRMPYIKDFNIPKNSIFAMCGLLVLAYIFSLADFSGANMLPLNIEALIMFIFAVQGVSVFFFLCEKKRIPKPICALFTAVMFFIGTLQTLLTIVGLIDLCFDLKLKVANGKKR